MAILKYDFDKVEQIVSDWNRAYSNVKTEIEKINNDSKKIVDFWESNSKVNFENELNKAITSLSDFEKKHDEILTLLTNIRNIYAQSNEEFINDIKSIVANNK